MWFKWLDDLLVYKSRYQRCVNSTVQRRVNIASLKQVRMITHLEYTLSNKTHFLINNYITLDLTFLNCMTKFMR